MILRLAGPLKNYHLFVCMKADQYQMNLFCSCIFRTNYTRSFFTSYSAILKRLQKQLKLHKSKNGFGYGISTELGLLMKTQLPAQSFTERVGCSYLDYLGHDQN